MNSDYQKPNYGSDKESSFASVALIMGILAILSICTGLLPLIFGGLGILFATLAKRRKQPLATPAIIGIVSSIFAMSISFFILVFSFIQLPIMLKDPDMRQELNDTYKAVSGMTFDEMMEQSGIDIDALLDKQ